MRWLMLFLLLCPAVMGDTLTVAFADTSHFWDTELSEQDIDTIRNFGEDYQIRLKNVTDYRATALFGRQNLSGVLHPAATIIYDSVWFYFDYASTATTVKLYQLHKSVIEGKGDLDGLIWDVSGGPSWNYYQPPTLALDIDSAEALASFSWRNYFDLLHVFDQSSCGSCWANAFMQACILNYQLQMMQDIETGNNNGNGVGVDRAGVPEFQTEDQPYEKIEDLTGWYSQKIEKLTANLALDTVSLIMIRGLADDSASFTIDGDSTKMILYYWDGDTAVPRWDTLQPARGDDFDVVAISDADTTLGMGGHRWQYINDSFSAILFRATNLKATLKGASGWDHVEILASSGNRIALWVVDIDTTGYVSTFAMHKPFVVGTADSSASATDGVTFTHWDVDNDYRWTMAGAQFAVPDFSVQQMVDCAGTGDGCSGGSDATGLQYARKSYHVSAAEYPYTGVDTEDCLDVGSMDSVGQLMWYVNSPKDIDSALALLLHGPITGVITYYTGGGFDGLSAGDCYCDSVGPDTNFHAIVIMGIDKDYVCCDGDTGAALILNSWGQGWADSGFAWVSLDQIDFGGLPIYNQTPKRWTTHGALCNITLGDGCVGDNESNTSSCSDAVCDHNGTATDEVYVDTTGWYGFELDPTLTRIGLAYELRVTTTSGNVRFQSSEGDSIPVNRIYYIPVLTVGNGTYGDGTYGN